MMIKLIKKTFLISFRHLRVLPSHVFFFFLIFTLRFFILEVVDFSN